jgi:EAL domain-containing protein (putative c-di-GMP-specific phosphodiesterase class I)
VETPTAHTLLSALHARELAVAFQPKVDLHTGRIQGAEALVRWTHPPDAFIGLAERTGIIHRLTRYVLREALATCRTWLDTGVRIPVAVNVSAVDLADPTLPEDVERALADHGVPAALLEIEITETQIIRDRERTEEVLRQLGELGVALAIDDFGTGHASLAQLVAMPVHVLKIDRSFVDGMIGDRRREAIVRSTVALGQALDLTGVAEGIEDEATAERLLDWRCHLGQGWLWGKAMPAADLTERLIDQSAPFRASVVQCVRQPAVSRGSRLAA